MFTSVCRQTSMSDLPGRSPASFLVRDRDPLADQDWKESIVRTPHALALSSAAAWMAVSSVPIRAQVSTAPSRADLQQQLDNLRTRLQSLESIQQTQASLSAEEVDRTVERVLKDAEDRSKLLADGAGFTAGYDKSRFF